jgi:hypothetical protein
LRGGSAKIKSMGTLKSTFSAVSEPIFASKCSCCSNFQRSGTLLHHSKPKIFAI